MPTKPRPEDRLIDLFLSAYDHNTWNSCKIDRLDQMQDGAVEVLATRSTDGLTLAIEHTLIQPYDHYSRDLAEHKVFLPIEEDQTLVARNRWISVFVPTGTLRRREDWSLIGQTVHEWLRDNALAIPVGEARHIVPFGGSYDRGLFIRVEEIPDFDGVLSVGIDGSHLPPDSLATVVDKALRTKVSKLARTIAKRRILLLERSEWTLSEDRIAGEIELRRRSFPELNQIQEIWFANTVAYKRSQYVRFSERRHGHPVKVLAFRKGRLRERDST